MKKTDKVENNFDLYHLIFGDKCIRKKVSTIYGDGYPTFENMLNIAKENGYKKGALMLICESASNGIIYMYGNDGDYWYEYGKTVGYE